MACEQPGQAPLRATGAAAANGTQCRPLFTPCRCRRWRLSCGCCPGCNRRSGRHSSLQPGQAGREFQSSRPAGRQGMRGIKSQVQVLSATAEPHGGERAHLRCRGTALHPHTRTALRWRRARAPPALRPCSGSGWQEGGGSWCRARAGGWPAQGTNLGIDIHTTLPSTPSTPHRPPTLHPNPPQRRHVSALPVSEVAGGQAGHGKGVGCSHSAGQQAGANRSEQIGTRPLAGAWTGRAPNNSSAPPPPPPPPAPSAAQRSTHRC